jgi:hypothetical protein
LRKDLQLFLMILVFSSKIPKNLVCWLGFLGDFSGTEQVTVYASYLVTSEPYAYYWLPSVWQVVTFI